ncbi:MAG: histidine kinase dimerization/phospho-acceptor domain-containing protein, partial [Planctomycetaceae bacterium]
MFLTNSIRRKMVFGLGLVVVMLAALLSSGLWGLASLRAIIHDDSLNAPAVSDVIAAIAKIRAAVPDVNRPPSRTEPLPVFDPQALQEALLEARSLIASYRSRLNSPDLRLQRAAAWNLLAFLERRLTEVQSAVEQQQPLPTEALQAELDLLLATASELPELPGLQTRLDVARDDYQTALSVVWISSAFVFLGLLGLVIFGIRCVFRPVNSLHQGARRVAQGDFSFRVAIESDDEVGELAESFNCMAGRFEEIATSLEREVEERSRQLVRSDRLASVGFLAAGVAHEVNNPLTAIQWSAESLESRLAELLHNAQDDEAVVVKQYVTMIQTEAERCQAITRKLLDFSRNHDSQKTRQDVVGIIREVVSLITHMKKFREARIELASPDQCQ